MGFGIRKAGTDGSQKNKQKNINENNWCGRHISLPHHISVKHFKLTEKTGVAKPYPCHTTFQTGAAAATPATPLPAPLPTTMWAMVTYQNIRKNQNHPFDHITYILKPLENWGIYNKVSITELNKDFQII